MGTREGVTEYAERTNAEEVFIEDIPDGAWVYDYDENELKELETKFDETLRCYADTPKGKELIFRCMELHENRASGKLVGEECFVAYRDIEAEIASLIQDYGGPDDRDIDGREALRALLKNLFPKRRLYEVEEIVKEISHCVDSIRESYCAYDTTRRREELSYCLDMDIFEVHKIRKARIRSQVMRCVYEHFSLKRLPKPDLHEQDTWVSVEHPLTGAPQCLWLSEFDKYVKWAEKLCRKYYHMSYPDAMAEKRRRDQLKNRK